MVMTQPENRERQRHRTWNACEITEDEDTFRKDIARTDGESQGMKKRKAEPEGIIENGQQLSADDLRRTCEMVSSNLTQLDFKEKRLALQTLKIRVLVDGDWITAQGAIPMGCVATTESA